MKGFLFRRDQELKDEFQKAQDYFEKNPLANKIRRKDWLSQGLRENVPKHSYLKLDDGRIVAIATGEGKNIGQGNSGRVKYAMSSQGHLYALKIETSYSEKQQQEANIARDVGVVEGETTSRIGGRKNVRKHYSTLHYLGVSLKDTLDYKKNLTVPSLFEKVVIARKLAWEVSKLHRGDVSATGQRYFHGDLKPDNVVLNSHGAVSLVDFGLSQVITEEAKKVPVAGSPEYLPSHTTREDLQRKMSSLGFEGVDLYALKKTMYSTSAPGIFSTRELDALPRRTQDVIRVSSNVNQEINNIMRLKSTPFRIITRLIEAEVQDLVPHLDLDDLPDEHAERLCACFALLDKCSAQDSHDFSIDDIHNYKRQIVESTQEGLNIIYLELDARLNDPSATVDLFKAMKQRFQEQTERTVSPRSITNFESNQRDLSDEDEGENDDPYGLC